MQIEVTVPPLLTDCTKGQVKFTLVAETLEEAMNTLLVTYPLLRTHLYDEDDKLRQHVLICYNNENIAWLDHLNVPLQKGDQLIVYQAVSGG
jgi:molybdopterin synthase sulfur carrier subunit